MKQYQEACVGAFIQNSKGEFMVVKRSDEDEFLPGYWELPGGGSDFGEELQETVVREVKEEVGLSVAVVKPLSVQTYMMEPFDAAQGKITEKIQRIEVTFLCSILENDEVQLSHEHSAYKWILASDVETLGFTEYMKRVIMESKKNI